MTYPYIFAVLVLVAIAWAGGYCWGRASRPRDAPPKPRQLWRVAAEPRGSTQVAFYAVHHDFDGRYPNLTAKWRQCLFTAPIDDLDARIEAQLKAEDRVETLNGLPS